MGNKVSEEILMQGFERVNAYKNVIELIQQGVSENMACNRYNVDIRKFRRWIRTNYVKPTNTDEFEYENDFFNWRDRLLYNITGKLDMYICDDFDEALEYVKTTLNEREVKIIELRYINDYTIEELGEVFGCSSTRVHEIENRLMNRLRHKSRLKPLLYGMEYVREMNLAKENAKKQQLEQIANELKELRDVPVDVSNVTSEDMFEIEVEKLHLCTRTYNCLKRNNLNTVADIINYNKSKGMSRLYGFGEASFNETNRLLGGILDYNSVID